MFQVRLSTGLLLVLLVALALGWLADRRQMQQQLQQAKLQNTIYQAQLDSLQKQLTESRNGMFVQTVMWWPSAEKFIEALQESPEEQSFLNMASSLKQADTALVQAAVPLLIELLSDRSERTRARATITLRFLQQGAPHLLKGHEAQVVMALIPRLDDSSSAVQGETIGALESFGPAAQPALAALQAKMADDQEWYAASAAEAIIAIDPDADITPRLVELVERQHADWYGTACLLARHAEPEVARRVLTKLYAEVKTEGERRSVINAMNQIQGD